MHGISFSLNPALWHETVRRFFIMPPLLRTPHGILFLFGGLLLSLGAFTAFDAGRRLDLETIEFPTSAGDTHFFRPQSALTPGTELVRQGGRPLRLNRASVFKKSDANMIPTGRDDSDQFTLYVRKPTSEEASPGTIRYLKIARHEYLAVDSAESPPQP
jgi:hypothetical protein